MGDINSHVFNIPQLPADLKQPLLPNPPEASPIPNTNEHNCSSPVSLTQKLTAETFASFVLVFTICAVKENNRKTGNSDSLEVALIGGLSVMVTIFSIKHISGSHINPAATIAYTVIRQFPLRLAPLYISAHVLGSIIAALLLQVLYYPLKKIGLASPTGTPLQAVLVEAVAGFVLLFVASAVSTDKRAIGELAGIAGGAAVTVVILFAAPISGGGISPARALGPAIVARDFQHVWIYVLGPIVGAVCGAATYRLLRLDEGDGDRIRSFRKRLFSRRSR